MELQTICRPKHHKESTTSKDYTGVMLPAQAKGLGKQIAELRNNASRPGPELGKLPRGLRLLTKQKEMQPIGTAEGTATSCGRCSSSVPGCVGCVRVCACFARFWVGVVIFHIGFDLK